MLKRPPVVRQAAFTLSKILKLLPQAYCPLYTEGLTKFQLFLKTVGCVKQGEDNLLGIHFNPVMAAEGFIIESTLQSLWWELAGNDGALFCDGDRFLLQCRFQPNFPALPWLKILSEGHMQGSGGEKHRTGMIDCEALRDSYRTGKGSYDSVRHLPGVRLRRPLEVQQKALTTVKLYDVPKLLNNKIGAVSLTGHPVCQYQHGIWGQGVRKICQSLSIG